MANGRKLSWAPSWKGILLIALTFLMGVVLGSVLTLILAKAGIGTEVSMLVSYPAMFLFTGILACVQGKKKGTAKSVLDRPVSGRDWLLFPLVAVLTFAASFVCDVLNSLLPEMPEYLQQALASATGGNFWLNFISVALMAPLLEEWLCRGMILRGLLKNGTHPAFAIALSALFFAAIHGNLWQALPAFLLGALFGYVYYKTGSLKLTVLMHFTNNFTSLLVSRIDEIGDTDSWINVMPEGCYWVLFVFFALSLITGIGALSRLHIVDSENVGSVPQGQ